MRLRYTEHGQGAEVVVLLHDLAESSLVWESLAVFLADMGYRVLAPDLRGKHPLVLSLKDWHLSYQHQQSAPVSVRFLQCSVQRSAGLDAMLTVGLPPALSYPLLRRVAAPHRSCCAIGRMISISHSMRCCSSLPDHILLLLPCIPCQYCQTTQFTKHHGLWRLASIKAGSSAPCGAI